MRIRIRFFSALALLILGGGIAGRAPVAQPVEAAHPVANFLRRLEEKGIIKPGFFSTLPRDAAEVAALLNQAKARETELGAWDRRKVERFLNEFDRERRRKSKLHYEDTVLTLHGGVEYFMGIYGRDSTPQVDVWASGSFTPSVEATYEDWGFLVGSASISSERSLNDRYIENYDPQRGLPYVAERVDLNTFSRRVATFDGYRLMMGVGTPRIRIEAGQDWNEWGPGHWQHSTLGTRPYFWVTDSLAANPDVGYRGSDFVNAFHGAHRHGYRYPGEGAPMPQARFTFRAAHFEYVKIIASRMGMDKDSGATLIAHRLQLKFGNWRIGLNEMIAIGTRDPDLVSLLPFIPLRLEEHSGGDRDNAAMSGDVEWIWTGVGRLYGELFIDDFSGLPLNYWSNKLAWVAGGSFHDPFGIPSIVNVEYARVDPWVYSHKFYNAAMQHYGALVGSSLPPNSHSIRAAAIFPIRGDFEGKVDWLFRQRDLKSRGSSIFDVYNAATDPLVKQFLAQDVETRNEFVAGLDWSWRRYASLHGQLGWLWVDSWQGTGETYVTPTWAVEMRLRY